MHLDPCDYRQISPQKMTLSPCTRLFSGLFVARLWLNKLIPEVDTMSERVKELSETMTEYGSSQHLRESDI